MATYTVTDPTTNKSVDLEGDSPPSEQELNQIFSAVHGDQPQASLGSRVAQGFMGDVQSLGGVVQRAGQGILGLPQDIYNTGKTAISGGDLNQSPLMQDARTVGGAITNAPGSMLKQFQEIGAEPLKYIPGQIGQTFQKYYPNNPFVEHPLNTALALSPLAKPAMGAVSDLPGVSQAAERAGNAISEPLQNLAQTTGRRALGLSKRFLNKSDSQLPAANAAAQTALDTGVIRNPILHPFSSSAEDMLSRSQSLDKNVGEQIGSFLQGQGESFDPYSAMQKLEELKSKLPPDDAIANQINSAQDLIAKTNDKFNGNIPFEEANKLKTYIQNKVNWNSDKATSQVGQKVAGSVRGSIDQQLENIAGQGGSTPDFKDFLQNKKLFGDAQIMQKGLLNKTSAESGNLPVSPYSLMTGISEFVHSGNPTRALMIAGGTELVKRYGSATAATMADSLAKLFSSNPSKYSSLLQNAIGKGGATLNAINQSLQSDPEYQKIINKNPNSPKPLFNKGVQDPQQNSDQLPAEPNNVSWMTSEPANNQDFKPADFSIPKQVSKSVPQQNKYLDDQTAMMYLDKANGDKEKARKMATQDGYTVI